MWLSPALLASTVNGAASAQCPGAGQAYPLGRVMKIELFYADGSSTGLVGPDEQDGEQQGRVLESFEGVLDTAIQIDPLASGKLQTSVGQFQ